jgi:general secretion pathway protein E
MTSLTERLELLIRAGGLPAGEAAHVRALSLGAGEAPDQLFSRLGLMSEADIAAAYAERSGAALLTELDPETGADPEFAALNADFLKASRCLTLRREDGGVTAVLADPFDTETLSALEFALDAPIHAAVAPAGLIERHTNRAHSASSPNTVTDFADDADRLRDMASAAPVVRLVSGLIAQAVERGASDIHIEPGPREAIVRQRVDGVLRETDRLSASEAMAAISRIKVLCDLDIAEHRRPQDGATRLPVAGRNVDLRVSVVPTDHGESLAVRLLDAQGGLRGLDQLGFSPELAATLAAALDRPNGLVLVTGPTGSGKTTTLYAGLRRLAGGDRKILTVEDPIEYRLPGVSQSQINPAIGLDFAASLRSFLRHDPDVIMVGEIRDAITARTAVQAALTGHLVLSTLHTNDAPGAVVRLIDMGIEPFLVASTLTGAFAQRLVRTTCTACAGAGCATCHDSGHAGRAVVGEGFLVDEPLRDLIRDGAGSDALREELRRRGWRSLADDARAKADAGLTSPEEAARAAGGHV